MELSEAEYARERHENLASDEKDNQDDEKFGVITEQNDLKRVDRVRDQLDRALLPCSKGHQARQENSYHSQFRFWGFEGGMPLMCVGSALHSESASLPVAESHVRLICKLEEQRSNVPEFVVRVRALVGTLREANNSELKRAETELQGITDRMHVAVKEQASTCEETREKMKQRKEALRHLKTLREAIDGLTERAESFTVKTACHDNCVARAVAVSGTEGAYQALVSTECRDIQQKADKLKRECQSLSASLTDVYSRIRQLEIDIRKTDVAIAWLDQAVVRAGRCLTDAKNVRVKLEELESDLGVVNSSADLLEVAPNNFSIEDCIYRLRELLNESPSLIAGRTGHDD